VALAEKSGFRVALRSGGPARARRADVLVLDTHGELVSFYGLGAAAFVGGTLVPVGGHNVLEPAAAGVPVLFGPFTANVRGEAAGLVREGGGFRVRSASGMASILGRLLSSRVLAARAGARARGFVRSRQGVARRVVTLLAREGLL
jgi:3-deoxy-D-manno-octulosonic-acid transferase